jgi:hypothetical protein
MKYIVSFFTLCASILIFASYHNNSPQGIPQLVSSVRVPTYADFAGEPLPLQYQDAKERFDRELHYHTYHHYALLQSLKLANRYFPVIEGVFAQYGVPSDFKYLAVAESDLRNAVSPAGARGIWQIMAATGKQYGLIINEEVDERYNLEKATAVACRYLTEAKGRLGSWTLAAASYNMGMTGLQKDIELQKENSFYDLNLNSETDRYVLRIIALKEIMSHPDLYGFKIEPADLFPPQTDYYVVNVSEPVESWADFAHKNNISYRQLKVYNPWLISSSLKNKDRHSFAVKIPRSKY